MSGSRRHGWLGQWQIGLSLLPPSATSAGVKGHQIETGWHTTIAYYITGTNYG